MLPLSRAKRTFSADICFRAARSGARGTPPSWQAAHRCLISVSPSLFRKVSPCCISALPSEAKRNENRLNAKLMEKFFMPFYRVGETKIDFGIIMWTPLLPSTSSVMWRSAATLESM
jgi:hypothetical protein